jgi:hypothetical protein
MMFSSLFQYFGKRERERERERDACAFSNDYVTTIHVPATTSCREGGGKKKYLQQSKKRTMSIIG